MLGRSDHKRFACLPVAAADSNFGRNFGKTTRRWDFEPHILRKHRNHRREESVQATRSCAAHVARKRAGPDRSAPARLAFLNSAVVEAPPVLRRERPELQPRLPSPHPFFQNRPSRLPGRLPNRRAAYRSLGKTARRLGWLFRSSCTVPSRRNRDLAPPNLTRERRADPSAKSVFSFGRTILVQRNARASVAT